MITVFLVTSLSTSHHVIAAALNADLAWSPDGTMIALSEGPYGCTEVAGSHVILLIYPATNQDLQRLSGNLCPILSVAWSHDSRQIATGSEDGSIQVWDALKGQVLLTMEQRPSWGRFGLAWSPDNSRIASLLVEGGSIEIWDASTGKYVSSYKNQTGLVTSVDWSPDGTRLANSSTDNRIRIWNVVTGENELILKGHTDEVASVEWSPSGNQLISSGKDKTFRIWDSITGKLIKTFQSHTGTVLSVRWSPNSHFVASGSDDKTIEIWNVDLGYQTDVIQSELGIVYDIEWSPDSNQLAYIGFDNTVAESPLFLIISPSLLNVEATLQPTITATSVP
jgi:WD40 repeat protein